jgi:hypothetical protein
MIAVVLLMAMAFPIISGSDISITYLITILLMTIFAMIGLNVIWSVI